MFKKDVRVEKGLAELLASKQDIVLATISSILKDTATKQYLERLRIKLRDELKHSLENKISALRNEFLARDSTSRGLGKLKRKVNELHERLAGLESSIGDLEDPFQRLGG